MLLRKQLQRPLSQRSVALLAWPPRRTVPFPARLLHGSSSSNRNDSYGGSISGSGSGNGDNSRNDNTAAAAASDQGVPQSRDPPSEQQQEEGEKKRISLWEELFPGESNRVFRAQLEEDAEPPRLQPQDFDVPADLNSDGSEQWDDSDGGSMVDGPRRPGGMLILSAASKHLEESDFMRLGVQGRHVEGWVSGIVKVIQARDPVTLEPFDYYYVLFDTRASAAAYSEAIFRLWRLSKQRAVAAHPPSSQLIFPSQSLSSGRVGSDADVDEERAVRSFTLTLPTQRHHIEQAEYPRTPNERWERMWGAAPNGRSWSEALADKLWPAYPPQWHLRPPSPWPSPELTTHRPRPPPSRPPPRLRYLVLVGMNGGDGRTTPVALRQALEEDGEDRNLPWRIPGIDEPDGGGSIVPIGRGIAIPGMEKMTKPIEAVSESRTQQANNAQPSSQPSPGPEAPENGVEEAGQEDKVNDTEDAISVDNVTITNVANHELGPAESQSPTPAAPVITTSTSATEGGEETHDTDNKKNNTTTSENGTESKRKDRDKRFYENGKDDGWKYRRYTQFIVAFEDEAEARRFVREWHARDVGLVRNEVLLRGAGRGKHRSAYTARAARWEERRELTASLLW